MPPLRHALAVPLLFALLLCGAQVFAAGVAFSSGIRQNTLIELYTSQGCSSCPPAERWLSGLKDDQRLWKTVIPVAFHVDYWNYLGWKDPYSRPAFSARQRRYHSDGSISAVYTPGFVINGREWRRWLGLNRLPDRAATTTGRLSLHVDAGTVTARYQSVQPRTGVVTLTLVTMLSGVHTAIARGENAGKTIAQDFIVVDYIRQHSKDGRWQLQLPPQQTPKGSGLAIAAWVSLDGEQRPLQAVGGWLSQSAATP